ncbi:ABC transporter permease [Paenibacillus naphthalenovorans]|uniref:Xylose transport system permease protein XylH n=1 Tax=Paenibacillus naphthalenovorans TaxID=162209 RepID=A0A0U2UIS7_9BACL|nr:ABC transporter permease [Paenibacillus naphthalenovorans]ALS21809.1 ribose ABC transporter permease [Paenibacillus naphthalenovorans]GCL71538.1 ABC transporter permease [Paenibacillus naphthalenovorans]SDI81932.1 simple sugar transport system permease protein/ribose transport system permease protein [Paenibacillus naphthalenovorans]
MSVKESNVAVSQPPLPLAQNEQRLVRLFANHIVWFLLVFGIIIMGLIDSTFFSKSILQNILVQTAVLGVLTAGMSFVLIIGEIDLSVVGVLAFSAGLGTTLMNGGLPWFLAVVVIVLFGVGVGFANGWLIAKLKAAALIETLAMGLILQGALMALTQGRSIINFPAAYTWIGQGTVAGLPVLPIPFLLIYLLVYFIWKQTVFGRSLFATGGNSRSAYVSGIRTDRIKIYAFAISGGLAGFSGYLLSAYMGAVTMTFGSDLLMYTLAAAVIGGVSLTGGRGSISGVLGGVLLLTVIQTGLQILGISSYYVTMVGGLMIFIAVVVDALKTKYLQ